LLRPEISAQIVNAYSYPSANEEALKFVKPEIANNPVIYPSRDTIAKATWYQPLSAEGLKLYDELWAKFMQSTR
jgi:putrescine transport system substrate-binding protein